MTDDLIPLIDRARELKKSKKYTMSEIRDLIVSEFNMDKSQISINRLSKLIRMGIKSKTLITLPSKCWDTLADINPSPSKAVQSLIQGHAASLPKFTDEKVAQFHGVLTQSGDVSMTWSQMQEAVTELGYSDLDLQFILRTLMQENFMTRDGDLWVLSSQRLPDPMLLAMGILQG